MKTFYDASEPPASPPDGYDGVAFYGGGDTPHVWTLPQIEAQPARYRLPIWVRSNPPGPGAAADSQVFVAWLASIGCPKGVTTLLDLETAVNPAYVNGFGWYLHLAGYKVLTYGSFDYLFKNPALDGYFPASPGATEIPTGCVGVQHTEDAGGGAYDEDWFDDSVIFWDTQPPTVNLEENGMNCKDPGSDGTWIVDPTDGHVEAFYGAPYLGGLNAPPDDYNWQQVGVISGIAPWFDNGEWGYSIIIRHNEVLPDGAWYSGYTFSRTKET